MADYSWYSKRWGTITRDDSELFLLLTVGVFQAGLSWQAAASKKEVFMSNFANMQASAVAAFFLEDISGPMSDPEMIRNPRKIKAVIKNARAIVKLSPEYNSFADYLWAFVDDQPIIEYYQSQDKLPNTHPLATLIAKDMKRRGFSFVGPIVTCMFLKSCGIIQDKIL